MIFDTLHMEISFGNGRLTIPAGTLTRLFGAPIAKLLVGTSSALEIRETQPVANDATQLVIRGKAVVDGLQLGSDTVVTATFGMNPAGGTGESALRATLLIECPEKWRLNDSFPGRPWGGPAGEAIVGSLQLHGASFTASNADAGMAPGAAEMTFKAQWQPQSALGVLASIAGQKTVETKGTLVLPAGTGPTPRLAEGKFPWDLKTAAGLYLEASVGSIDLISGTLEKATIGARVYVPLWYDPGSSRAPFEPMLGYVGALSIPNGGQFVLTARSWGLQDEDLIVKAAFAAGSDSHHESALAQLMQGSSAREFLPEPIRQAISSLEIADVVFHLTAGQGGIRLATTSVGVTFAHAPKDAWSPLPGFAWPITLTGMRVVILHGTGEVPTQYFGTLTAALNDVCGANLEVTVLAPDFSISAVQTSGTLNPVKLLDTCLPGVPRPPLPTVDRLSLTIEPGSYYACSVSIHPDHSWQIDNEHGHYRLPDVRVTVSDRGWQFDARVEAGERGVPIFALAAQLAREIDGLRGLTLPPVLEGLTIDAVGLSYATGTRDFFLECEGSLTFGETHPDVPPAIRATFTAAVTHDDDGKVASQQFGGRLFVAAKSEAPLEFDLEFGSSRSASILLAGFHNAGGRPIKVIDLLTALPDTATLRSGVPESLAFALHDAVFVCERGSPGDIPQKPAAMRVLIGLDVEAGLELSAPSLPGLPLIGHASSGEPLRLALQVTGASAEFTAPDVAAIKGLSDAARFLPDTGVPARVNLNAALRVGNEQKTLSLPVGVGVNDVGATSPTSAEPARADAADAADRTQWKDVRKSFGPLRVERVGVEFQQARLTVLLDAGITIAGLTVSLDGLSATTALKPWAPTFGLRGLGIDYRNDAIEIGGAFLLHQVRTGEVDAKGEPVEVPGFAGFAIVRAQELTLSASGLFVQLHGHPSLFLYAVLDHEFGGPPFFFVTGLAAGFGYNRTILLPDVEDLANFPLIAQAKPALPAPATSALPAATGAAGAAAGATRRDPMQMLNALERYVPPALGESFLAVGVRFTSFRIVDSFALLVGRLSHRLEIDLLGLSTVISPPAAPGLPASTPIVQAQIALKATFIPDEGILTVRGLITPGSYLMARQCQLSGGFAFYTWFKDREGVRAGDFVLTIGGYHPAFDRPPHYPVVSRLQLQWQVNDHLSIKGSAYFALTAHAVMAGGLLEAVWTDTDVVASFTAAADFLISWQPYHYDASVWVGLRADVTIHAFGTHHLTFEAGAKVHLWGPEFSGRASIYLRILVFDVSINVAFGDQASLPAALDWASFRKAFLPEELCGIGIADGLLRTIAPSPGGPKADERWIVDPVRCAFVVTSSIPLTGEDHNRARLAVGPMGLRPDELESALGIRVLHGGSDVTTLFSAEAFAKAVPAALWGRAVVREEYGKRFVEFPKANDKRLLDDVPVGFTLKPKEVVHKGKVITDSVARNVDADKRAGAFGRLASSAQPAGTIGNGQRKVSWDVEYVDHHQPAMESGDYVIEVTQTVKAATVAVVAPKAPTTRAFSVLGPRFRLSPPDIEAVFPPAGNVGDHVGVVPHVLFGRTTLPWERSPEPTARPKGATSVPPWLALIVVHQDEVSLVNIGTERAETNPLRVRTCTVGDMKREAASGWLPPGQTEVKPESGDSDADAVSFIELCVSSAPKGQPWNRTALDTFLPTRDQLTKLAHVRRSTTDANQSGWKECAVVLCNRPVKPNSRSTLHLVSVEGRYGHDGRFAVAEGQQSVRLVCLKSWQCACTDQGDQDFRQALAKLSSGNLGLSTAPAGTNAGSHVNADGVQLPHWKADGSAATAWYKSPLAAFERADRQPSITIVDVHAASELLRHDSASGTDDVTYAAAWELGRLLALQNSAASDALYNWKRARYQEVRAREAGTAAAAHLPIAPPLPAFAFPRDWFEQLAQLKGVPFNYLVPDDEMLPTESIRFFRVDAYWVKCLMTGAFSVGSTSRRELDTCTAEGRRELQGLPRSLSGFLLRSRAVSAWPTLEVDGYLTVPASGAAPNVLHPLMPPTRLGPDVLLCLFEGVIDAVDIHLPPAGLHFHVQDTLKIDAYQSPSDLGQKLVAAVPSARFAAA